MSSIALQRLYNEQLENTSLRTPAEVVSWLGAVQAQEYQHAKWALGMRLNGVTEAAVEQAFTDGAILRTHVMRPTWHFVTPEDIRWLLELTAPRVHTVNGTMYRQLELDEALLVRSSDVIAKALEGGKQLTRLELGAILAENGIHATGVRLGYIVHYAELEAVICSGARRGKQFTYALLDERAPQAKSLARQEALIELTKRYFTSHGPALVKDFAWWSGLTKTDVKAGLELSKPYLQEEIIDDKEFWYAPSMVTDTPSKPSKAYLLPPYDEFTIAYQDHSATLAGDFSQQAKELVFGGTIMINGKILGYWRRSFSRGAAVLTLEPFRPLTSAEMEAVEAATQPFSEFLEMPVVLAAPEMQ